LSTSRAANWRFSAAMRSSPVLVLTHTLDHAAIHMSIPATPGRSGPPRERVRSRTVRRMRAWWRRGSETHGYGRGTPRVAVVRGRSSTARARAWS
jgi:hypothetical protein